MSVAKKPAREKRRSPTPKKKKKPASSSSSSSSSSKKGKRLPNKGDKRVTAQKAVDIKKREAEKRKEAEKKKEAPPAAAKRRKSKSPPKASKKAAQATSPTEGKTASSKTGGSPAPPPDLAGGGEDTLRLGTQAEHHEGARPKSAGAAPPPDNDGGTKPKSRGAAPPPAARPKSKVGKARLPSEEAPTDPGAISDPETTAAAADPEAPADVGRSEAADVASAEGALTRDAPVSLAPDALLTAAPSVGSGAAASGSMALALRPEGPDDAKVWEWLSSLDNGKGNLLQYFGPIKSEFDGDLLQLAAAKLETPVAPGVLGSVEPTFFEVLGVKTVGHRLLLAKGILALPDEG